MVSPKIDVKEKIEKGVSATIEFVAGSDDEFNLAFYADKDCNQRLTLKADGSTDTEVTMHLTSTASLRYMQCGVVVVLVVCVCAAVRSSTWVC